MIQQKRTVGFRLSLRVLLKFAAIAALPLVAGVPATSLATYNVEQTDCVASLLVRAGDAELKKTRDFALTIFHQQALIKRSINNFFFIANPQIYKYKSIALFGNECPSRCYISIAYKSHANNFRWYNSIVFVPWLTSGYIFLTRDHAEFDNATGKLKPHISRADTAMLPLLDHPSKNTALVITAPGASHHPYSMNHIAITEAQITEGNGETEDIDGYSKCAMK